ncbi:F-box-like, partial [Rhizoctonia solani]
MDTLAKLQDWEELDAQLEDIVSAYYRTCHILERMITDSSSVDAAPLERRMGDRYTRFIRPLSHSFASIARSRNNLRTPLHRMPTEVLGRIFEFVVDTDTRYMPMNVAIQTMYLSLHRLMGVCSVWRNVAQNHFPLWTLIPILDLNTRSLGVTETWFSRSLERSRAANLRLAVSVGSLDINNLPIREKLLSQAHRFRSINIRASSLSTIESILKPILTAPAPKFLREISLCYEPPQGHNAQAPYYLFSSVTYPVLSAFEVALGFVGILRLKSVLPPPYSRCYSNLVELRLQDIRFGINTCFEQFLGTLSSATQLQSLDLISVLTSITHHHADDKRIMVRLPLLKHLYLENLDLNILESVFLTIEPGQYYTSLMMTQRCLLSVSLIGVIQDDLNRFRQVFKSSKIYTLLLKEHSPVFGPRRLHFILSCMPTVDTLSLDGQTLSHQYLLALTRPPNSSVPFPKLQTIYISRSIIDAIQDQAAFRNMLSSHPLQTLYLGGSFNMATAANSAEFLTDPGRCRVDIAGPDTWAILTRDWIKANIPNFTVWPHDVYGQLRSTEWELW